MQVFHILFTGRFGAHRLQRGLQRRLHLGDQRIFLNALGQHRDAGQEIFDDGWLVQKAGRFRRVGGLDQPAADIRAPDPRSQRHQDHQVGVFLLLHAELYLILGRFQLFPERIPVIALREIVDAVAATEHALVHVQLFGQVDDLLADIFHALAVLSLHRDVSVCHQRAEDQRDLWAAGSGLRCLHMHKLFPVGPAQLVDRRKELTGHGDRNSLHANNLFDLVGRQIFLRRADIPRQYGGQGCPE